MKYFFLFFFSLLFLSSLAPPSLGIGISPPKLYMTYEEGKVVPLDIYIINNGNSHDVSMYKQGWLAQYVSLSEKNFSFNKENYHMIHAVFKMPPYNTITEYGPQRFYIGAHDIVKSSGTISASAAIKMWVSVDIPFPGKYAVLHSLLVKNINQGENATASITIANRGTNDLTNARLKISLINFDGDSIDETTFHDVSIKVDTNKTFEHLFKTDEDTSGIYYAQANFFYDDNTSLKKSTTFFIGSTDVILTNYTPFLRKGIINKINLTLQSIWGSPLKNVRLSIVSQGKTTPLPALDLNPFEKRVVEGFIELPKLSDNITALNATLHMSIPVTDETLFEKDIPLQFQLFSKPEKEHPLSFSTITILFILSSLLLVILAINVFLFAGKKRESSSKEKKRKKEKRKNSSSKKSK